MILIIFHVTKNVPSKFLVDLNLGAWTKHLQKLIDVLETGLFLVHIILTKIQLKIKINQFLKVSTTTTWNMKNLILLRTLVPYSEVIASA